METMESQIELKMSTNDDPSPRVGFRVGASILKIDDVSNTFTVDFELYLHYDVPHLQNDHKDTFIRIEPPTDWKPHIVFFNSEDRKISEVYHLHPKLGKMFVALNWMIEFREPLELHRFPFDRQHFNMFFFCANAKLVPWKMDVSPDDYPEMSFVTTALGNWKLENFEVKKRHANIHIVAGAERKVEYYFWNIIFVLFLLVGMAWTSVAIDPTALADRQSVNITLVLTGVAYKYVLSQMLPAISYLTVLDKYVIVCYVLLSLAVVENFVVAMIAKANKDLAEIVDLLYALSCSVFWVLCHFLFLVFWKFNVFRKSWKKTKEEDNSAEQILFWERKTV